MRNREDLRFITGKGNYVDDVHLSGTLHASFLRSPYPHAKIKNIDFSQALDLPGVLAVVTGKELADSLPPLPLFMQGPGVKRFTKYGLALDKVRCVGEPVAAVIAEDKYLADDALELIMVDYEPLDPLVDPREARQEKVNVLFEGWEDNVLSSQSWTGGDFEGALKNADKVVNVTVAMGRACGAAMEGRGVIADYEPRSNKLTVWVTSQTPHGTRKRLGMALGLGEDRIRVISPDVGGGFGIKGGLYIEQITCSYISMKLGRPVKWMESRRESISCSQHGRDQEHILEVAVKNDGQILGLKDQAIADVGSPLLMNLASVFMAARLVLGCYKIPNFLIEIAGVATNKGPLGPVRGNGKPEGAFVIERVIDEVSRTLGLDPAEVRLKNFIQPDEFPYDNGTGHTYDSGNYPGALRKLLDLSNYKMLKDEVEGLRREGKLVGLGMASYLDAGGFGPSHNLGMAGYERATIRVDPRGKVSILTGIHSHGQTLETTLSKICSDQLTIDIDDVSVLYGDTDIVPFGVGTFGSRSCAVGGSAVLLAAKQIKAKMLEIAAGMLKVSSEHIDLGKGKFYVKDDANQLITFREVADAAYNVAKLPTGVDLGLESTVYFDPPGLIYGSGSHLAMVEIDPNSGSIAIKKYFAVDDAGKVVNHTAVEGQIVGGVAHGVGNALLEEIVYSSDGQLLTSTFMDYLLPSAIEVPHMILNSIETPSPLNPLGVKGVGESGTIGAIPAIVNAAADALAPLGATVPQIPLTPERVWNAIRVAKKIGTN
ncbi:MAG: xanthine dehydrogenase family protein molybdopterin-binding subunit [Thaumarchaeota archaeon]|nr:xanthine dehydrogenase family protein molybdopterin-binding subunit [Nitrososphaerota archaeon]